MNHVHRHGRLRERFLKHVLYDPGADSWLGLAWVIVLAAPECSASLPTAPHLSQTPTRFISCGSGTPMGRVTRNKGRAHPSPSPAGLSRGSIDGRDEPGHARQFTY